MTTYDLHQHLWPAPFVTALRKRANPPRLVGNELTTAEGTFTIELRDHDPESRLETLDRDGVDVAVLSLQPSLGLDGLPDEDRGELEDGWAEAVRDLVAAGAGRFLAFSPTSVRTGFAGVSLGSSTFADLERSAGLLDAAAAAEAVVFVHPDIGGRADPARPAWWEW